MDTYLPSADISNLIKNAFAIREGLLEASHTTALRLFNGFYEGVPDLVADLYGRTLVLFSHHQDIQFAQLQMQSARDTFLEILPWIKCVVSKYRGEEDPAQRFGSLTLGSQPDTQINESGIQYALDLLMNQDASFYLDTRNLRVWLKDHSAGKEVLNTFAYTGSLGVAALAGGASKIFQVDRNARFLDMARKSAMLNHFDLGRMKLSVVDFFVAVGQLKQQKRLFDTVILDPPFFSSTDKGVVNQVGDSARLINKVRPLVRDGGRLVIINNALFLSGKEYMGELESLSANGFLEIETLIPVPEDITGTPVTRRNEPPVDPAPFNHPTKIAILKVKRKG
jgi:23S rRNA (cytosine1962-C5)-methyltransferase